MARPLFDHSVQYWTTKERCDALQSIADARMITRAQLMREIEGIYLHHVMGSIDTAPRLTNGHAVDHRESVS